MLTLNDYVNWGLTHCDKVGSAEGVPLVLENCVKNKKMKQFEVYGASEGVGDLVTNESDANYGKYKVPVVVRGNNLFDCSNAKSLYNAAISGNKITNTETGVMWTPHSTASFAHIDLGLASDYAGKTLVASFDVDDQDGELSLGDTRYVTCDADGANRTAVSGTVIRDNGHYYIKSTLAEGDYGERHLTLRLYMREATAYQEYEFKNMMVSESDTDVSFEPYVEPETTNVYLNAPLDSDDVLNFKEKNVYTKSIVKETVDCNLPTLTAKTSVIEINTSVAPSNIKGKYIKR